MSGLNFNAEQMKIAKRLAGCAPFYWTAFLNKEKFRNQFTDNFAALDCFLDNYAHERQGAAPAYPKIANQVIEEMFGGKLRSVTENSACEAWNKYLEIAERDFNNISVLESHNPMRYPKGILTVMATENVTNIANHVKTKLEKKETRGAHLFVDSINGVGTKIASFYLRDIAYLSGIDETQIVDEHYLQPMDTWLEQSLRIIMRNSIPKKLQDRQRAIVDLCHQAGCSPIAFNQGAWVLGSQIAKNFNTFRKIASGDSVNQYLEDYIAEKRIYLQAIENTVEKLIT